MSEPQPSHAGVYRDNAAPVDRCASCQNPIVERYYKFQDKPLCVPCHGKLLASIGGNDVGSFRQALVLGSGAALLGAAVYWGISAVGHIKLSVIAVVVGLLVGKAVAYGARGQGGSSSRWLALALAYAAIALSYAPEIFAVKGPQAVVGGYGTATFLTLVSPLLMLFSSPLAGLIDLVSLFIAWRVSRTERVPLSGPHVVTAPPPSPIV